MALNEPLPYFTVNMSKIEMLRLLINQRLTAAAEEIFLVFGRTIALYEEEISRSRRELDRQRRLLDLSRTPQVCLQAAASGERRLARTHTRRPASQPLPQYNQRVFWFLLSSLGAAELRFRFGTGREKGGVCEWSGVCAQPAAS